MELVLASGSPRRLELLKLITEDFSVIPADCEEHFDSALSPEEAEAFEKQTEVLSPEETEAFEKQTEALLPERAETPEDLISADAAERLEEFFREYRGIDIKV